VEIHDAALNVFCMDGLLNSPNDMGRGYAWLDYRTHGSLLDCGGTLCGPWKPTGAANWRSPEKKIAFVQVGLIDATALEEQAKLFEKKRIWCLFR